MLNESCPNFDQSQIQDEGGDFQLEKIEDVSYFDLEVVEVHNVNDVNLAKPHATSALANAKFLDTCKRSIAVPSNEHGYKLCDGHEDEDLNPIEKRRAYKRIWQQKYKLH